MTTEINDGGPAFPHDDSMSATTRPGMTLRDYFAAKVLPTAIEHWRHMDDAEEGGGIFLWWTYADKKDHCSAAAELAYVMADAMIKVRSQK